MKDNQIIAKLAALPLIVRGSQDEVFKAVRELQEAAWKANASLLDSDSQAAGSNELDDIKAIRARAYNTIPFSADTYMHDVRRLLHLYPQLNDRAATAMRDKCVEKVRELRSEWQQKHEQLKTDADLIEKLSLEGDMRVADTIITALESLTLDQVKQKEQSNGLS